MRIKKGLIANSDLYKDIFCFLLIFSSGTITAISRYYKQFNIAFLCCAFIGIIFKKRFKVNGGYFACYAIMCLSLLLQNLRPGRDATTYVGIFMELTAAFLLALWYDYPTFRKSYVRVMYFLAAVSIPMFIFGFMFPTLIMKLPHAPAISHVEYYNALIYEYKHSIYTNELLNRNASIFWEPGVYAFFINLAIFFIVEENTRLDKKTIIKLLVLCTALITTMSTTGFIVCAVLLTVFFAKRKNYSVISLIVLFAAIAIYTANKLPGFDEAVVGKFQNIFDDPTVAMRRIDLTSVWQTFNILDETPFFGISFENYFKFIGGAANSWVYYFVSLGVLFAVPTCMLLLSSANKYRHRILYLFLIIVSLSSESLLVKPLLLYLLFSECLKSNKMERMDRLL